jgi:hypothetical protein
MTGFASKRAMSKDKSLEDEILTNMARQMVKDIDTEILMTTMGWKECKLELSEGRVYGSRYLTVHPENGWHWNEMMQWMVDTFGPTAHDGVWTPNMRWYANNAKFWFRNEKDLNWFILRWSS